MTDGITTETRGGRVVYKLRDDASGATASILPGYGFNLFDLRLPAAGKIRSVIASDPDWPDHPSHPARQGIPILFPYPNRIRDGKFSFGGREFHVPITNGPNGIHGFALDAPWDVVEAGRVGGTVKIVGRYQISKQSQEMRASWPTDAVLEVAYELAGRRLTMTSTVSNPTAEDLPYGFGIHPYFRLPFEPSGDLARTLVVLPASRTWPLKDFLPTGQTTPVDERLDFRKGKPIKDLKLDDVLTDLMIDGRMGITRLVDRALNAECRILFDRTFRELVVYTPATAGVIAVEPYTQTTDAINLQPHGIDAGLRILKHDQSANHVLAIETVG